MDKILKVTFFLFTVSCFIQNVQSQPKETIAGRYEDHGFWREHPYTMFNKRKGNWDLKEELKIIRHNIYSGINPDDSTKFSKLNNYAQLYSEIYPASASKKSVTLTHACGVCL